MPAATTEMAHDAGPDAVITMDATSTDTDMDVGITVPVLVLDTAAMPGLRIVRVLEVDGDMVPDTMTTRRQTLSPSQGVGTMGVLRGQTSHKSVISNLRGSHLRT